MKVPVCPGPWYEFVFLGLARDCAEGVRFALIKFRELRGAGLRAAFIVGEDGSSDDTREILEEAAATDASIRIIGTEKLAEYSTRLERMARGRQMLHDELKNLGITSRFVCVVDLDEPFLSRLSYGQLLRVGSRLESSFCFAAGATSRPFYYDLLSYNDGIRSYPDIECLTKTLRRHPLRYYLFFRWIYSQQKALTSSSCILCVSSFNGLAIYKFERYISGNYLSSAREPNECEHVTFNKSIFAQTNEWMYIDPQLVVGMPAEHGPRSPIGFVVQRIRKLRSFL